MLLAFKGVDENSTHHVKVRENDAITRLSLRNKVLVFISIRNESDSKYIKSLITFYHNRGCLLYTSPSPRDRQKSRMPSSA